MCENILILNCGCHLELSGNGKCGKTVGDRAILSKFLTFCFINPGYNEFLPQMESVDSLENH